METLTIARKLIHIAKDFNARLKYEGIDNLADDIKRNGLLQPIVVRESKAKNGEGSAYEIIAGHRRFKALEKLEWDAVPCVLSVFKEEIDAIFANLDENVARQNLSGYELARKINEIREKHGMAPTAIGRRLGAVSSSYIGNLLRIMEKVAPKIIERWGKESEAPKPEDAEREIKIQKICTTDFLAELAKYDHKEQLTKFEERLRALRLLQGSGEDEEGDEDDDEATAGKRKSRPKADAIFGLIDAIKEWQGDGRLKKANLDLVEFATKCLYFAGGRTKKVTCGDFRFDPKDSK
jgi:ParB/RepB/Spo0J family partition protein